MINATASAKPASGASRITTGSVPPADSATWVRSVLSGGDRSTPDRFAVQRSAAPSRASSTVKISSCHSGFAAAIDTVVMTTSRPTRPRTISGWRSSRALARKARSSRRTKNRMQAHLDAIGAASEATVRPERPRTESLMIRSMNAGDVFRHYQVIDRVGEGGMGVVYRARDTKLDRDVALKFMVHAAPAGLGVPRPASARGPGAGGPEPSQHPHHP